MVILHTLKDSLLFENPKVEKLLPHVLYNLKKKSCMHVQAENIASPASHIRWSKEPGLTIQLI